jgi:hypothetical protein
MRQTLLQCFDLVRGMIGSQERLANRRGVWRICEIRAKVVWGEQSRHIQIRGASSMGPKDIGVVVMAGGCEEILGFGSAWSERRIEPRTTS